MSETLFRGKRKENSEWVHGCLYICNDGQYEISFYDEDYDVTRCLCDIIPETVGQFTGLTDKNGKKIFEGDILRNIESNAFVVICYGGCSFCYSYNGTIYGVDDIEAVIETNEWEVIGNIYDNPELLLNYNKIGYYRLRR